MVGFRKQLASKLNEVVYMGIQYPFGSSQYEDIYNLANKYIKSGKIKPINVEAAFAKAKKEILADLNSELADSDDDDNEYIKDDLANFTKAKNFKQLATAASHAGWDFWSFGINVYKAVTGKNPPDSETQCAAMVAAVLVVSGVYKSLDEMADSLEFDT